MQGNYDGAKMITASFQNLERKMETENCNCTVEECHYQAR